MATRAQIVTCAREYVGTPFRHQGRQRGKAVDCVGLLVCVAHDLNLLDVHGVPVLRTDYRNYSAQPVDGFVHEECGRRLIHKPFDAAGGLGRILPGDVLTIRLPVIPCHTAIVTSLQGGLGIVHAYSSIGRVVEHVLNMQWLEGNVKWLKGVAGVFEFPGTVG